LKKYYRQIYGHPFMQSFLQNEPPRRKQRGITRRAAGEQDPTDGIKNCFDKDGQTEHELYLNL
jgi:hypothetical protein